MQILYNLNKKFYDTNTQTVIYNWYYYVPDITVVICTEPTPLQQNFAGTEQELQTYLQSTYGAE